MNKLVLFSLMTIFCLTVQAQKNILLVEAESFAQKGGWVVDQQFMDQIRSLLHIAT